MRRVCLWTPLSLLLFVVGVVVGLSWTEEIGGSDTAAAQDPPASAATFTEYAVAADHPSASAAGAEILAHGGNAADAAAATMLALGVASPMSSGLGGGGFALYFRKSDRSVTFLDFRERAPAAATPTMFDTAPHGEGPISDASQLGGLAVAVPGEPAGIAELLHRFGRRSFAQVAQPAIRLAEHGFVPSDYLVRASHIVSASLAHDPLFSLWIASGEEGLSSGRQLTNPELARTLRTLGARGVSAFYSGGLGRTFITSVHSHGGVLTASDLRAYRVVARVPIEATRIGHRVVSAPPESSGGYVVLSTLDLLERWNAARDTEPVLAFHEAEALKGPIADRLRYVGDPDFVDVPLARLLADDRRAARAAILSPRAQPSSAWALPLAADPVAPGARPSDDHGTSHICVVDAEGNVASVTTTVNLPFGARFSVLGLWPNDEMDDFARGAAAATGSPNLAVAGHRPASSMAPTIVFGDDGLPSLCIGGSGGAKIPQEVTEVLFRIVARGEAPGAAIAAPRLYVMGENVELERDAARATRDELSHRGENVVDAQLPAMVQAIRIAPGQLDAASDPRKGGRPAGR